MVNKWSIEIEHRCRKTKSQTIGAVLVKEVSSAIGIHVFCDVEGRDILTAKVKMVGDITLGFYSTHNELTEPLNLVTHFMSLSESSWRQRNKLK